MTVLPTASGISLATQVAPSMSIVFLRKESVQISSSGVPQARRCS